MKEGYLPQSERKKILLLCDDIRMHSGIATMAREFVIGTSHKYNWAQIAGSINHPDKGKIMDLSEATKAESGVPDPYVRLFPVDGYGNPEILMQLIAQEKPDAILHFTDPRFWIWLYNIEREIRQIMPIGFYSIWDDLPYPMYNRPYYQSCDWIGCISKQTENIVKSILGKDINAPTNVTYVPHGINPKQYYTITDAAELKKMEMVKKQLLKKDYKFVMLYNNRNIRRKQTSTILMAWRAFCDNLTKEEAAQCVFLLHTNPIEEAGTDLIAVKEAFCPNYNVIFSTGKYNTAEMNYLYNLADVTINLSDNEGFGLGTAESLMAGTPIIVNVTGGLQDQCGFTDDEGKPIQFTTGWGTNADGRCKNHGKWVTPVYPSSRALQGSVPTPYILADYVRWEDAAECIMYWYMLSREKRKELGQAGREFCLGSGGLNSENMCNSMIEGLDGMMARWKGRERFNIHRHDEHIGHNMPNGELGYIIPKIDRSKIVEKLEVK